MSNIKNTYILCADSETAEKKKKRNTSDTSPSTAPVGVIVDFDGTIFNSNIYLLLYSWAKYLILFTIA